MQINGTLSRAEKIITFYPTRTKKCAMSVWVGVDVFKNRILFEYILLCLLLLLVACCRRRCIVF